MSCTLFLDFDGVTHPDPCQKSKFFCQLPLIEDVLREHLGVTIVISSSWRYDHTLPELKAFFSPDLRDRVAGTTPSVKRTDDEGWIPRDLLHHHREWECRKWLRENAHPAENWVALDDMTDWFLPNCPHLLTTASEFGFVVAQVEALRNLILSSSRQTI